MLFLWLLQSFGLFLIFTNPSAWADISITFGGDLNLSASRDPIREDGAYKHGRFYTWAEMVDGIRPFLDGDLNFANVETVVSDSNNLPAAQTKFVFNTHIQGMREMIRAGFNLFSLANNHTGDYGAPGMRATIDSMNLLEREFSSTSPIYHSGLAETRSEALRPSILEIQSKKGLFRIAFLSMTGVSNTQAQATSGRPGTLYFRDPADFDEGLSALQRAQADYRILSVHWGKEGVVSVDADRIRRYHQAIELGEVDLLLAHHPHRVQPIEKHGDSLIFYSLGNYLMLGAANLSRRPTAEDYGLLGKLHLSWDSEKRKLVAYQLEALALTDVHSSPRPMTVNQNVRRMTVLNQLGRQYLGTSAVQLLPPDPQQNWPAGLACLGPSPRDHESHPSQDPKSSPWSQGCI